MSPTVSTLFARYFAATPPAAPVRISVTYVPSITAMTFPVTGSFSRIVAMTVGRPCSGLSGWTFTHLMPAVPTDGT